MPTTEPWRKNYEPFREVNACTLVLPVPYCMGAKLPIPGIEGRDSARGAKLYPGLQQPGGVWAGAGVMLKVCGIDTLPAALLPYRRRRFRILSTLITYRIHKTVSALSIPDQVFVGW